MTQSERENLTDICDIASDLEMKFAAHALAAVQSKVKRDQEPDSDGVYKVLDCILCGNEIGEGRLNAAARNFLCIHCATKIERGRG